mmetsp:Transcript_433/g.1319  ORF Transcript_433/g.1319 Transcript_433/m.1319 type:complete len:120 (-) Transcript_433:1336-1695(-)
MSCDTADALDKVSGTFNDAVANALGVLADSTTNTVHSATVVGKLVTDLEIAWQKYEAEDEAREEEREREHNARIVFPLAPDVVDETVQMARALCQTVVAIEKQVKAVEREQVLQERGGV